MNKPIPNHKVDAKSYAKGYKKAVASLTRCGYLVKDFTDGYLCVSIEEGLAIKEDTILINYLSQQGHEIRELYECLTKPIVSC